MSHYQYEKNEIMLNLIAQGLKTVSEGIDWFENMSVDEKNEVLRDLYILCTQAGAGCRHVDEAIKNSQLKPTYTPCVLLKKCVGNNIKDQLVKIVTLPLNEKSKSFRLLLSLFTVADKERRTERCKGECYHWWHQDLTEYL